MKEKIENLKETVRIIAKNTMIYGIIIISVIASFIVGYTYHKLNSKVPDEKEVIKVRKSDVTIAIDEHHRLIVINNESGDYTIFQDSIGKSIFKIYAANVWGQHNTMSH